MVNPAGQLMLAAAVVAVRADEGVGSEHFRGVSRFCADMLRCEAASQ